MAGWQTATRRRKKTKGIDIEDMYSFELPAAAPQPQHGAPQEAGAAAVDTSRNHHGAAQPTSTPNMETSDDQSDFTTVGRGRRGRKSQAQSRDAQSTEEPMSDTVTAEQLTDESTDRQEDVEAEVAMTGMNVKAEVRADHTATPWSTRDHTNQASSAADSSGLRVSASEFVPPEAKLKAFQLQQLVEIYPDHPTAVLTEALEKHRYDVNRAVEALWNTNMPAMVLPPIQQLAEMLPGHTTAVLTEALEKHGYDVQRAAEALLDPLLDSISEPQASIPNQNTYLKAALRASASEFIPPELSKANASADIQDCAPSPSECRPQAESEKGTSGLRLSASELVHPEGQRKETGLRASASEFVPPLTPPKIEPMQAAGKGVDTNEADTKNPVVNGDKGQLRTSKELGVIVHNLVLEGLADEAWDLVREMLENPTQKNLVNTVICSVVMKGFVRWKELDQVFDVHNVMFEHDIPRSTTSYNLMFDACAHCNAMEHAPELLEEMRANDVEPNVITYSTVVKGFCLSGDLFRALLVFEQLRDDGKLVPDEIIYNSLLECCAQHHRLEDAMNLLTDMNQNGVAPSQYTTNIMVKLFGRTGHLEQAFQIIERHKNKMQKEPNIQVHTSLLQACAQNGQGHRALKLHDDMIAGGEASPDQKYYDVMVCCLLQAEFLETAVCAVRCAFGLPGHDMVQPSRSPTPGVDKDLVGELALRCKRGSQEECELGSRMLDDLKEYTGLIVEPKSGPTIVWKGCGMSQDRFKYCALCQKWTKNLKDWERHKASQDHLANTKGTKQQRIDHLFSELSCNPPDAEEQDPTESDNPDTVAKHSEGCTNGLVGSEEHAVCSEATGILKFFVKESGNELGPPGLSCSDMEKRAEWRKRCEGQWRMMRVRRGHRDEELESAIFGNKGNHTGELAPNPQSLKVSAIGRGASDALKLTLVSFAHPDISELLQRNISRCGYIHPTPIQRSVIRVALKARDIMACAQTGSGKTCAFMVPIIEQMLRVGPIQLAAASGKSSLEMPTAMVLVPTRELAVQVFQESRKFAFSTGIKCSVVFGGVDIAAQRHDLQRGCDVLVATPGRLFDLFQRRFVKLGGVCLVVFDEADRMLDMGFEPQVRQIVEHSDFGNQTALARQSMMFSATFATDMQFLARDFLNDCIHLSIGRIGSAAMLVTQKVLQADSRDTMDTLIGVLTATETVAELEASSVILIFVETKKEAAAVERRLHQEGFPAVSIHGDKKQQERMQALRDFQEGRCPILVATDVAARGLDIPNVRLVINHTMPRDIESYVHRIGRTGRAGRTGTAVTIVDERCPTSLLAKLKNKLQEVNSEIPDWLEERSDFQREWKMSIDRAVLRGIIRARNTDVEE
eukprot:gnl/MRDRNA2_/MRDRNA2_88291_c0_seq1.p1 gnl/MRDRNA2_/MRDRNA2_88291_c0~~gnl/MRDRNA2_/MRDRNA2_88291_c0_seq1.p1  ORF type:complete len:1392 (+),score=293.79 gnl/MRDRNA2_/MRDRNA2_88291_c0_seq1:97-4176(+)